MERRVLKFENIFLRTLNKNTNLKEKYVELISGVSGEAVSGRLSAIMGGSGSSKTSLLNVLVGKVRSDALTSGIVTFDGRQRETYEWLSTISYLEQFDVFMPNLTVEESISYSLAFRGKEIKPSNIPEKVAGIMEELGLTGIRGSLLSSISGGERRRVMLAVELVVDPDIVFLDEPTTGLDSHLALDTVKILKKYARDKNKIVLMTVHQPGYKIFNLFDDIIFLNRGTVLYSGPAQDIDPFLEMHGMRRPPEIPIPEYLFELHDGNPNAQTTSAASMYEDPTPKLLDTASLESNSQYCIVSTMSWSHIYHLLIRQLKADYRGGVMRNIFLFKILTSTILFFFLCDKMKYSVFSFINRVYPSYTQLGQDYVDDLRVTLNRNYEYLGISHDDILDFFAYNMVPFITSFSIFNDSTFLDHCRFLKKESLTCNYSQISLIISVLIYECAFAMFRSLYFCVILSLTQLKAVLTTRTFLMFTLMPLGMVMFMNLAKILSSGTYPLNITRVAAFVLTTFLRSLWLSKEFEELERRYTFMKYLYPGTYLLFFCPFILLDALFYVTLGGQNTISPGFIMFLKKMNKISVDDDLPLDKILSHNMTFLNKHFLSDEFLAILVILSFASVLVLSIIFLTLRLSPSVRLVLSTRSLERQLDSITVNKD